MKEAAEMVVNLMAVSARTAPKAGGKDFLEIVVITANDDLQRIAEAMKGYAPQEHQRILLAEGCGQHRAFRRAAAGWTQGVQRRRLRLRRLRPSRLQRFHGEPARSCDKAMGYIGPHCALRMMDIGVALASAAKTAGILNVDNRVQQRVGAAARALGTHPRRGCHGNPVSISGKSIYFDRKVPGK